MIKSTFVETLSEAKTSTVNLKSCHFLQPANWSNTWTFEKAKEHCMTYFRSVPAVGACLGVRGVDWRTALSDCILDIKVDTD